MSAFERWSVWLTSVLTFLSGVVYLWMKYLLETADPWAVVNHPLQPLVLKLHILVAPLMVFALGLITLRHVWRHFRNAMPVGRGSGIMTALMAAPMVVTGYLIQAITHPVWLTVMIVAHVVTGVVYIVGLTVHQVMVRRGAVRDRLTPQGSWQTRTFGLQSRRSDAQTALQTLTRSDAQTPRSSQTTVAPLRCDLPPLPENR